MKPKKQTIKTVDELNIFVMYEGKISMVTSIANGKSITITPIDAKPCPHCRSIPKVTLLEDSPLFQSKVMPVKTITCPPAQKSAPDADVKSVI
jgi:hypothetical protein